MLVAKYVQMWLILFQTSISVPQKPPYDAQRKYRNVQVGNDQEQVQSERDSHSKNRGGKIQIVNKVLILRNRKPSEQLFSQ